MLFTVDSDFVKFPMDGKKKAPMIVVNRDAM